MGGDTDTKYGAETEGNAVQRQLHLVDPSLIQLANPDIIVDVKYYLLTGD